MTLAASVRSARTASMASAYSGRSAATASVTERIGVFWLVLASDFTLRSAARAAPARATSSARSIGSLTTEASRQGAGAAATVASSASHGIPMDRANLEALRTLMARRRPILIWVSSKAASRPRRAELAQ